MMELLIAEDFTLPPLVFLTAKIAGISLTVNRTRTLDCYPLPFLRFTPMVEANGYKFVSINSFLLYLVKKATTLPNLHRPDRFENFEIQSWLEYAPIFSCGSKYEGACKYVDNHLLHRTFLVGSTLSLADIAIWSYFAADRWWRPFGGKRRRFHAYRNLEGRIAITLAYQLREIGVDKRWESLMKLKEYQNLTRWYNMISTDLAFVLN